MIKQGTLAALLAIVVAACCLSWPVLAFSPPSSGSTGRFVRGSPMQVASPASPASPSSTKENLPRPVSTGEGDDSTMDMDAFDMLANLAVTLLYQSDMRRDAKGNDNGSGSGSGSGNSKGSTGTGSSATNWIDDKSSFALRQALNNIELKLPDERVGLDRDEAMSWLRWMKTSPTPLIIDLTSDLVEAVSASASTPASASSSSSKGTKVLLSEEALSTIGTNENDFFRRIGCRLYLFPSGSELKRPLVEPTGAIIFGKVLYGGVKRFRLLGSQKQKQRRVGEQSAIKATRKDDVPSWILFGGSDRKYECLDMGSAAVLEITVLPKGMKTSSILDSSGNRDMALQRMDWKPQQMFHFESKATENGIGGSNSNGGGHSDLSVGNLAMSLAGKSRNDAFTNEFQSAVGGLSAQIEEIVRRVLDGRIIRPVEEDGNDVDDEWEVGRELSQAASQATLEAEELALLGLRPVRGLLLYGPPGCGKTALAREISKALRARKPKIVAAPELLDKWVGSSEKMIRNLFSDAEAELAACNGDPSKSALHVIIVDEIDGIFRKRSSSEDSGEVTRASAVNQILAKLDGVNAIPNVLLIGMTNRRELLDPALLRPGRLEVQIEIPLPNKEGRREILQIHFDALRKRGRLSRPLCCAIDGVKHISGDGDGFDDTIGNEGKRSKREKLKKLIQQSLSSASNFDLAADSITGGFSGADLQGLVRCAGSIALARVRQNDQGVENLQLTLEDVKSALVEVKR